MIANWQRKYLDEGFEGLNKSVGGLNTMSKNKKEKNTLNIKKSEKEELIRLREENEFLRASLEYEKKLKIVDSEELELINVIKNIFEKSNNNSL